MYTKRRRYTIVQKLKLPVCVSLCRCVCVVGGVDRSGLNHVIHTLPVRANETRVPRLPLTTVQASKKLVPPSWAFPCFDNFRTSASHHCRLVMTSPSHAQLPFSNPLLSNLARALLYDIIHHTCNINSRTCYALTSALDQKSTQL